jgi:hypothetical protein
VRFASTYPRQHQGQIVEIAYGTLERFGAGPGDPYKRVHDQASGAPEFYRLEDA